MKSQMKSHWKAKASIIRTTIALIPLWILLILLLFLPEGFWQNLIITGVVVPVLCAAQLILLFLLFGWLFVFLARD